MAVNICESISDQNKYSTFPAGYIYLTGGHKKSVAFSCELNGKIGLSTNPKNRRLQHLEKCHMLRSLRLFSLRCWYLMVQKSGELPVLYEILLHQKWNIIHISRISSSAVGSKLRNGYPSQNKVIPCNRNMCGLEKGSLTFLIEELRLDHWTILLSYIKRFLTPGANCLLDSCHVGIDVDEFHCCAVRELFHYHGFWSQNST